MFFSYKILTRLPPKIVQQNRNMFYWINVQFNAVDNDRKTQLGPDRTCAEWILKNGGRVKFLSFKEFLADYNELPPEGNVLRLKEVDASHTSIMHTGFEHFKGCKDIDTLILHKCSYVDDKALEQLHYLSESLTNLQLSCCQNVTDNGILSLGALQKLLKLKLADLISVKKLDEDIQTLKSVLPQCTVETTKK